MVQVHKLTAGQVKLLLFLADEGEVPRQIVRATSEALLAQGLVFKDEHKRYQATELGYSVAAILKAVGGAGAGAAGACADAGAE